jgi:hypothetical protein
MRQPAGVFGAVQTGFAQPPGHAKNVGETFEFPPLTTGVVPVG